MAFRKAQHPPKAPLEGARSPPSWQLRLGYSSGFSVPANGNFSPTGPAPASRPHSSLHVRFYLSAPLGSHESFCQHSAPPGHRSRCRAGQTTQLLGSIWQKGGGALRITVQRTPTQAGRGPLVLWGHNLAQHRTPGHPAELEPCVQDQHRRN